MLAASIVAGNYAENVEDGVLAATLSTGITNLLIAQQVTLMVVVILGITAGTAYTAAARSS